MKIVRKEFNDMDELNKFIDRKELNDRRIINIETSSVSSFILFYWDWK